jgi:hypothetical protein
MQSTSSGMSLRAGFVRPKILSDMSPRQYDIILLTPSWFFFHLLAASVKASFARLIIFSASATLDATVVGISRHGVALGSQALLSPSKLSTRYTFTFMFQL